MEARQFCQAEAEIPGSGSFNTASSPARAGWTDERSGGRGGVRFPLSFVFNTHLFNGFRAHCLGANTRLRSRNDRRISTCHPLESSVQHRQVRDFGFLNFDQVEAVLDWYNFLRS